jgi:hypothetical protein
MEDLRWMVTEVVQLLLVPAAGLAVVAVASRLLREFR